MVIRFAVCHLSRSYQNRSRVSEWSGEENEGTNISRTTTVKDIPSKGGELHSEHHLGSSDFHGLIVLVLDGADNVAVKNCMSDISKSNGNDERTSQSSGP